VLGATESLDRCCRAAAACFLLQSSKEHASGHAVEFPAAFRRRRLRRGRAGGELSGDRRNFEHRAALAI